ncbi:Lecithin:cholesterol/phospholipid:diacylglycerol acyltransferase, partial [Cladochytrium replicatum]
KHPIVIIPGIASTNLEAWPQATNASKSCGSQHYRKRLWGSLEQFGIMLTSKDCWMQAMMLDPETGLDSPNASIKLRAVEGVTGADYMFTGYWVFAKMIENLAYIGYDTTNMAVAGYDWRLSPTLLEERDGYMTALKNRIERMVKVTGELAVVVPHSMGNLVFFYFLNWIESVEPGWAGKNLKSWFGIAGPLLGAPQSLAGAVLTGDMGNTASLSPMTYKAVEQVISRKDRLALYRTWGGVATLFPRGGDVVWGGDMAGEFGADKSRDDGDRAWAIPAPDEVHRSIESFCLKLVDALPLDESADEFLSTGCKHYHLAQSKSDLESARHDPRAWTNVLLTPLPSTLPRDFQIYCAYGLAQPTERKFFVVAQQQQQQQQGEKAEWDYRIDAELVDADEGTRNGMQHTDGDLTVPIMSSGFMCARGWRMRRYNPAGVGVVTREIEDRRSSGDRGGPGAADHTDVLGNYALVEDVLRVVSGVGGLEDRIVSEIRRISERVRLPEGLDE